MSVIWMRDEGRWSLPGAGDHLGEGEPERRTSGRHDTVASVT